MKNELLILVIVVSIGSCGKTPSSGDDHNQLKIIWNHDYEIQSAPQADPIVFEDSYLVYSGGKGITVLDISTGLKEWSDASTINTALNGDIILYDDVNIAIAHSKELYIWEAKSGILEDNKSAKDGIRLFDGGENSVINGGYALVGDTLDLYVLDNEREIRFTIDVEYPTNVVGYGGQRLFIGQFKTINGALTKGKIRAFEASNGDSLWTFETDEGGFVWAAPIVENGVVYAGTYLGNPSRVFALDAETGDMIWERPGFSTYQMITNENRIYVNTQGSLQAIEKSNGEIAWRVIFESSGTANIVYLKGYVYHVRDKELVVVEDSTGEVVHREPVPDGTFFWHVAASSDKIFAQTSNQLIAYQAWHLRD